ncbi:unnamed protein product [Cuscuta campestris]|uniref:Uncharacterized protein n=1 Tax=Cuscuta campestris TaxID=132261 RepID=A0A484NC64_9ASTE|nr:unnamed protein product [Cuscuta campestris]
MAARSAAVSLARCLLSILIINSGKLISAGCAPAGKMTCNGVTKATYNCSPPTTSATPAVLTLNDFSKGGDGGGASECDGRWHNNSFRMVALSTGWYDGGRRCGRIVRVTRGDGRRSTTAKVVDECDSMMGCDAEHAGQMPCDNNIVDGSKAVWEALELDQDLGTVPVTWTMA